MDLTKKEKTFDKNVKLFDRWASSYDFAPFQFWMKRFHKPVLNTIPNGKIRILDLSCGSGELLKEIGIQFPNAELYGVDISTNMLEVARQKLPKRVKLQQMDVHELKYPEGYFDLVVSTEAFHHYYDQALVLKEMKRVVKNEGIVMVVDINFIFHFVHRIFEKIETGCVKVNSKKEIEKLFVESGLKKVSQKRNFLFSVATMGVKSKNK